MYVPTSIYMCRSTNMYIQWANSVTVFKPPVMMTMPLDICTTIVNARAFPGVCISSVRINPWFSWCRSQRKESIMKLQQRNANGMILLSRDCEADFDAGFHFAVFHVMRKRKFFC